MRGLMARMVPFFCLLIATVAVAEDKKLTREEKLKLDRERVESQGRWLYNDLAEGFAKAKETGQPMMVVLRCVPCEECVKLDDELVDQDPAISKLLDEFVCVRQVSTNGLDLNIFQYDTDQSFAVFFLNSDGTVYGRFGTRSHRTEWLTDVSLEGMAEAMKAALALHKRYPENRQSLEGKQGTEPDVTSPEQYPSLRDKYTSRLKSGGELVKSCIHCHQIGDAQREYYWTSKEPVPERIIFQYPHPKTLGLILDPTKRATLGEVVSGSLADEAGFKSGDELITINGQPLISMADIQWVLHNTPAEGGTLVARVRRDGAIQSVELQLNKGWRELDDISWRASSWGLRRMATGGMKLDPVEAADRQRMGIEEDSMALVAAHVGQYGPHAAAKERGFQKGDVLVAFDGRTDLVRETDVMAYVMRNKKPGDEVSIEFIRNGKRQTRKIPIQE